MKYTVRDLRDNLANKVLGLGIVSNFKDNPSFRAALIEIDMLMAQMNMFKEADVIEVTEESNTISFNWNNKYEEEFSFRINRLSDKSFSCIMINDRKPGLNKNGKKEKNKSVVEKVAVLDDNDEVILTTHGSNLCGIDGENITHNRTWCDRKIYTAMGVMREREFRTYPDNPLNSLIDDLKIDSILYIPRQVFEQGFMSEKYETRNLLVRNKIDTVRVFVEDRLQKKKFMGELEIDGHHGYRNLELIRDFTYPKEVLIRKKSKVEIEEMIKSAKNSVIEEGLRMYAADRENYYYSSVEDNCFLCEVPDNNKKVMGI